MEDEWKRGKKSICQPHMFNYYAIIVCRDNDSSNVLSHQQKDILVF